MPALVFMSAIFAGQSEITPPQRIDTIIVRDQDVVVEEGGPNGGTGKSTGYYFFGRRSKILDFPGSFRKRVLHKGSSVGLTQQTRDEVYYILSGTGVLTVNGSRRRVEAGTAILKRAGNSYSFEQEGDQDLVMIVAGTD
jgi:mannose-6-phosphate isomerase-like protein (cupin superfamily)